MERFVFRLKFVDVFLVILSVKFTDQGQDGRIGYREANFVQHPNKILNTFKISSYKTYSAFSCAHDCLKTALCLSFNVAIFPNEDDRLDCQLLSSNADEHTAFNNLQPSERFNHFSILNPCELSPCLNGGRCIPGCAKHQHKCDCAPGFGGLQCNKVVKSCRDLMEDGVTQNGVYTIRPDEQEPLKVYCDQTTDGGGWIVLQKRVSPFNTSFDRNWEEYKTGFGNLTGEFWLGNDNIHRLAATPVSFRVDLQENGGNKLHARYENFVVAGADDKYRWKMDSYSGNLTNAIYGSRQTTFRETEMEFSTPDRDNDNTNKTNCAAKRSCGWWFNWCGLAILNHVQGPQWAQSLTSPYNFTWASVSEMKVRST